MAEQVLEKLDDSISRLKKIIVTNRYVNCYSRNFFQGNQKGLNRFLSKLREAYKKIIYIDIDIQVFENYESEEEEAKVLLKLINRELTEKGLKSLKIQVISTDNVIYKSSNGLDRQALLVFHYFSDLYSEKEKNILRSLRKTLSNSNQLSSYLGLLIISNRSISQWELFPESNLDERYIAFFEV